MANFESTLKSNQESLKSSVCAVELHPGRPVEELGTKTMGYDLPLSVRTTIVDSLDIGPLPVDDSVHMLFEKKICL